MSQPQRIAQYIQRLAYETLIDRDERDERPDDAPQAPQPVPNFVTWYGNAVSGYVPFRAPPNR